ncbi:prephenate dehydrogenase/arogenate dehydrogenase family protein [Candidatus Neomarinimicrobiota bacterium]
MSTIDKTDVSIIGYGRFGPVLTGLLKASHNVTAFDLADISQLAPVTGATPCTWEVAMQAETIFLAVPIRELKYVVAKMAKDIKPGQTVIDVCSVKVYPATVLKEHLPDGVQIIASHPLFGPDSFGEGYSDLPIMMHPVSTPGTAYQYWHNHFSQLGLRVIEMTPEEHDRIAARTQGITHFVGRVLTEYGIAPTAIDTEGFRDLLGVVEQTCNDSLQLFHDLENYNPYTMEMVGQLMKAMETVRAGIIRRD